MSTNETKNVRPPQAAPLARDHGGRPVRLPEQAVAWQIRRHTGGRPRQVLDGDKQPMQWPLDYTSDDAEEILPPGTYRLDAVDEHGDMVGVTIPISVGEIRNAHDADQSEMATVRASELPNTDNEVRLVLEANVRSTELAFRHNERNLELGFRMAETLRDGIHVLASSQSDWIRAISSSKGFFRSPSVMQLPAPADDERDDADGTDSEDQNDHSSSAPVLPAGIDLNQILGQAVSNFVTSALQNGMPGMAGLLDWRKARAPVDTDSQPHEQTNRRKEPSGTSPAPSKLPALTSEQQMKLLQINSALTPDERELVRIVLGDLTPEQMAKWVAELDSLTVQEAAAQLRAYMQPAPKKETTDGNASASVTPPKNGTTP